MGVCSGKPSADMKSLDYPHVSNVGTRNKLLSRKMKQVAIKMQETALPPLLDAAMRGDTHKLEQLLSNGADVNERCVGSKVTALHLAAKRDKVDAARVLLDAGADVNAQSTYHETPLLMAAENGATASVRLLVSAHAQVNCVDREGMSPLHVAARLMKENISLILLEAGAELNKKNFSGYTPYGIAEDWGARATSTMLKQRGGLRFP